MFSGIYDFQNNKNISTLSLYKLGKKIIFQLEAIIQFCNKLKIRLS